MNILIGMIFYPLLFAFIFFLLYFFISFRKEKSEADKKAVEEKFVISVAILFLWYGPYVIAFIVVAIFLDAFGKFFR